jgi:hypothetical protein
MFIWCNSYILTVKCTSCLYVAGHNDFDAGNIIRAIGREWALKIETFFGALKWQMSEASAIK